MSAAGEAAPVVGLPPEWARLEAAVGEAVAALELWRKRAEQAEAEVMRLRDALEAATSEIPATADSARQIRRLRAENTALLSRMAQAQRRIDGLLSWTDALEGQE